jgi:hypothetical protein
MQSPLVGRAALFFWPTATRPARFQERFSDTVFGLRWRIGCVNFLKSTCISVDKDVSIRNVWLNLPQPRRGPAPVPAVVQVL